LLHLPSFEAVLGPKVDRWLVRTVGRARLAGRLGLGATEGPMVNCDDVPAELREAQTDFHQLLNRANPQDLRRRADGTRWTNRQLLFHMVFGYIIVRTLMPLVHILGRLGWSRRFATALNAVHRPFHVINYLGSCAGGELLSPPRMAALMDNTMNAIQRRLAAEPPTAWD